MTRPSLRVWVERVLQEASKLCVVLEGADDHHRDVKKSTQTQKFRKPNRKPFLSL